MGVAYLENSPLKGERLFENERWVIIFAGDIVDYGSIPHEKIIEKLETGKYSFFSNFNGYFSIAAYDKTKEMLFLISDRRSWHPIFYAEENGNIYFSTEMSTFCRLKRKFKFNEKWLWEYLYFNFPIGDTTFLNGVKRMSPASIIIYNKNSGKYSILEYTERFEKKLNLLDATEALELAKEIFTKRVPKYFEGKKDIACSLTQGWDARTILSLSPTLNVTAFTYGTPGCRDLKGSSKTARLAGIPHKVIIFNSKFIDKLPYYLLETIFISSGWEKILRATLLYAYDKLTEGGKKFSITTSGIGLDILFRGHATSPEIISSGLAVLFYGGKIEIDKDLWSSVLRDEYLVFKEYIINKLETLRDEYGDFSFPEHHLSYLMYEVVPKYYCGEMKIANNFTALRVPGLDPQIIELAYSIKKSTLYFSDYAEKVHDKRERLILQSYLFKELSPRFMKIPVRNTRPDFVLKGNIFYQFYRIKEGLLNKMLNLFPKNREIPLEDWQAWLNGIHKEFIDKLIFSKNSRIRKYFKNEYLDQLKEKRELQEIGKLGTAEIILRLLENNWERFW